MRLRRTGLTAIIALTFLLYPVLVSFFPPASHPALVFAQEKKANPGPVTPPTLTLPATKKVRAGRTFYLVPKTNCTAVNWDIPPLAADGSGLTQDTEIQLKDPLAVALVADLPAGATGATYTVQAYGALGGQAVLAKCVITVGTPGPPPPPPPPPPPDSLTLALQTAYTSDTDATKAALIKSLQSLYTTVAASVVGDPSLATLADLLKVVQTDAAAALLGDPTKVLVNTRAAVAAYLVSQLGTDGTVTLSDAERAKAKTTFSNIAAALGNVK